MINKLVSVKNAIVEAQEILGIDHDKDVPVFTMWATRAEEKIGSYYQYERKRVVVTVEGCVACLPSDAVLIEIAVTGDQGEDCGDLLSRYCNNQSVTNTNLAGQSNFLVIDVGGAIGDTITMGYLNYHVQNNKLIFDNDARSGQKMTVQYLRYKTDCDGNMEIIYNHIDAVKWYIVWNYYIRNKNKNYIDRDMINMAKMEWDNNCKQARAEDARMSFSEREQAAKMYSNPFTGRGLWQGMYTTLGNSFKIW